jgi:hypothetical protein
MLDMNRSRRRRDLRFVRYYVVVARPFSDVERDILSGLSAWLPSIVESSRDHAVSLLVGLGVEKALLSASSQVQLGHARRTKQATRIPVEVFVAPPPSEASGDGAGPTSPGGLHPLFIGQFEIAPIGPNSTQIAVAASYRPLPGVVKRIGGRALLHRLAEAATREFMEQLGARLSRGQT